MNIRICWLLLCILILAPAICVAEVISSYDMVWQTTKYEVIPFCTLDLYVWEDGLSSAKILNTVISPLDTGLTLTATSADTGFNNFVEFITNGANGYVVVDLKSPDGQDLSNWVMESAVFTKPTSGVSDLQGSTISVIGLKVNNFELSPIWGGDYTYASCDFTFSVSETPEPCMMGLLLLGTLFLRKKQK